MVRPDFQIRVINAIGEAAERSMDAYALPAPRRARAWRLEQRHALAFVKPQEWEDLDLDRLFKEPGEESGTIPSEPAALGYQLRLLLDDARQQAIGSRAREIIDVAAAASQPLAGAAVQAALRSLQRVALPLAYHSARDDLVALVRELPTVARDLGDLEVEQIEPVIADLTRAVYRARRDAGDQQLILDAAREAAALPMPEINELGRAGPEVVQPIHPRQPSAPELRFIPGDAVFDQLIDKVEPAEPMGPGPFVNVGFAHGHDARRRIDLAQLATDTLYWFWVEIGPHVDDALAGAQEPVNLEALVGAQELDVVVFADPDLEVSPAPARGAVAITDEGVFPVVRPAMSLDRGEVGELAQRRLYFGVRTPDDAGVHLLRCGLYVRGLLVHLEQVTVPVGPLPEALGVRTTFRLLTELAADFSAVAEHRLSIYVNQQPDGSHGFSFHGLDGSLRYAEQVRLEGLEVATMIKEARETLQQVSWGDREEFDQSRHGSRYEPDDDDHRFAETSQVSTDLVQLAVAGHRLWLQFAQQLGADPDEPRKLEAIMRSPGLVQLAPREDPDLLVPLQLLYDRAVDAGNQAALTLCSASSAWLQQPTDELPCLTNGCSEPDDDLRVCPAGFWGFRHAVSITPSRPNKCRSGLLDSVIVRGRPEALAALTSDNNVQPLAQPHVQRLSNLFSVVDTNTRDGVRDELRSGARQLVYFLCHLRHEGSVPVVVVGPVNGPGIDATTLYRWKLDLCHAQPLVFLNACNSAAAAPERLLGLVDQFMRYGAAAALGTEITVFVSLAVPFAERLLEQFVASRPLGESIRRARVALLGAGNPLGLAYIAFGLPGFHMATAKETPEPGSEAQPLSGRMEGSA